MQEARALRRFEESEHDAPTIRFEAAHALVSSEVDRSPLPLERDADIRTSPRRSCGAAGAHGSASAVPRRFAALTPLTSPQKPRPSSMMRASGR
jgi:hypothetical protein